MRLVFREHARRMAAASSPAHLGPDDPADGPPPTAHHPSAHAAPSATASTTLAKLPDAERTPWQTLWKGVTALLDKAR